MGQNPGITKRCNSRVPDGIGKDGVSPWWDGSGRKDVVRWTASVERELGQLGLETMKVAPPVDVAITTLVFGIDTRKQGTPVCRVWCKRPNGRPVLGADVLCIRG